MVWRKRIGMAQTPIRPTLASRERGGNTERERERERREREEREEGEEREELTNHGDDSVDKGVKRVVVVIHPRFLRHMA